MPLDFLLFGAQPKNRQTIQSKLRRQNQLYMHFMEGRNMSVSPWRLLNSILIECREDRLVQLESFQSKMQAFFEQTLQSDRLFQRYFKHRLLLLAHDSPFDDVCTVLKDVLKQQGVEPTDVTLDFSRFMSPPYPPQFQDKRIRKIHESCVKQSILITGRVANYKKVMSYYPEYLQLQLKLTTHLLEMTSPLEYQWRQYSKFMAAATHYCDYVMRLVEDQMQRHGGDITMYYQEGQCRVPDKIKQLGELNVILAHQPWQFNVQHIQRLVQEGEWVFEELVHALILMISYHTISWFSFAVGTAPEYDLPLTRETHERESELAFVQVGEELQTATSNSLIERLRNYDERISKISKEIDPVILEEAEIMNADYFIQFAGAELSYFDYDQTMEKKTIHPTEFFWVGIGDEILERVLPETGHLITELLMNIKTMTDHKLGSVQNVETERLRQAIWNYTQRLFGILYEYYNYADVNLLLDIPTKTYIKKVACYPHTVTKSDYMAAKAKLGISDTEMIHAAALICEAKREVELLYLAKALKAHMDMFR